MVVEEGEHEDLLAMDVAVEKIQVPHLVWPNRFVTAGMVAALGLRREVAGVLHDAADGLDRHTVAIAAELVANLRRSEAALLVPFGADAAVAVGFDILGVGAAWR